MSYLNEKFMLDQMIDASLLSWTLKADSIAAEFLKSGDIAIGFNLEFLHTASLQVRGETVDLILGDFQVSLIRGLLFKTAREVHLSNATLEINFDVGSRIVASCVGPTEWLTIEIIRGAERARLYY